MSPIKTAVLGVGLAGLTFHVPFILALDTLFSLAAVLERNPASPGGKLKDRFDVSAKVYKTLDQVLADKKIELVIVGTPNSTHYDFAKAALQAGKHVLVDKPITADIEQAKELHELAKAKKLVLYAFQNRRYDADFLALKHLISSNALGTITEFESRFDRFRPTLKGNWKDDPDLPAAGMTYDLGSHLIDQALTLFGRPNKITGFLQNSRGIGSVDIDDTFTIHMHYLRTDSRSHPLTVILRAHPLSVASRQVRYVVRGTTGTYTKYGVDVQEDQLKNIVHPKDIFSDDFGREPVEMWGQIEILNSDGTIVESKWPPESPGSMVDLFKNLAASIRGEEEMAIKWEESTEVIELIQIAKQSSKEGKTFNV